MDSASVKSLLSRSGEIDSDSPRLDLELLLAHVLNKDRVFLRAWPEYRLGADQLACFEHLLARRCGGEPLAYLTGSKAFWTLDLRLNADTLIPRPETETLVQEALARYPEAPVRVLDLGTGSGAIALALASERPEWQLDAVDVVPACVEMARCNAQRYGLNNVNVRLSDWFSDVTGSYHMIVSNPPYIDPLDPHLEQGDVRHEPRRALVAAGHGMAAIEHIVATAAGYMERGGYLLIEHGWNQGEACTRLLADAGYHEVCCIQDLGGRDRVSVGRVAMVA